MRRRLIAAGFKFAPPEALEPHRRRWRAARTRRRHYHPRPRPVGCLTDLFRHLEAQGPQRQGLARSRARRARNIRITSRRSRCTRRISTSPTPRCSRSQTPIRVNGCTSSCHSMLSGRGSSAIAPSASSRRRAPASCSRALTTTPWIGAAECAHTRSGVGGEHMSAPDPLGPIPHKIASCIRMLLSAPATASVPLPYLASNGSCRPSARTRRARLLTTTR